MKICPDVVREDDPSSINQARSLANTVIRSRPAPGFSTRHDTIDSSMEIDVLRAESKGEKQVSLAKSIAPA